MIKLQKLKDVFSPVGKKSVPLRVGDKLMRFTDTQARRLHELSAYRRRTRKPEPASSLEKSRYSLEEAAFRLLIDEDELLQRAAAGSVSLFVDATNFRGRWRQKLADGESRQSSLQSLRSGFLALTGSSCRELSGFGSCTASLLELRRASDGADIDLDEEIVAALSAWGDGRKFFCLEEPVVVHSRSVVLLAPLT